jgi:hypothetical protein
VLAETILSDSISLDNEIETHLTSGSSLLAFFLQNIIKAENPNERKMYAKGLIDVAGSAAGLRLKIEKLIRAIVIKSGNSNSHDIKGMLKRSVKLSREVKAVGELMPLDKVRSLYKLNRTIMLRHSDEAQNAVRITSNDVFK